MLTPETIIRLSKLQPEVVQSLLQGIEKTDLEVLLTGISGTPQSEIARMNCVGGLRACGYIVEGGRSGRGKPYRIIGWEEKGEVLPASEWKGEQRIILDYVHSFPKIDDTFSSRIDRILSYLPTTYIAHENCFGYLICYELARDAGFFYEETEGSCVIIKKFENTPRFRIFNLNLLPENLLTLSRYLSSASLGIVSILNLTQDEVKELKGLDRKGTVGKRQEALYPTREISQYPEKFINARGITQLRKNCRDTELIQNIENKFDLDQARVVNIWKDHLESRHRQLAITRDFVSIFLQGSTLSYLGRRSGSPVAANVLYQLSNRPDIASDLMNKSLNYSAMPGGRPGTADWLLVKVCEDLAERGIEWYQAGGIDGGGVGLPAHKARYATQYFTSLTFYPSFDHLKREDILRK